MLGKIVRSFVYLIIILGVSWASALAAPTYGSAIVSVSCGSVQMGGIYVQLQTPPDTDGAALVGGETEANGQVTFIQIGVGWWDVLVDGKIRTSVYVPDEMTTLTWVEVCPFRIYLPTAAQD